MMLPLIQTLSLLIVMESVIPVLLDSGKLPFTSAEQSGTLTQLHGTWLSSTSRSGGKSLLGIIFSYLSICSKRSAFQTYARDIAQVDRKTKTFQMCCLLRKDNLLTGINFTGKNLRVSFFNVSIWLIDRKGIYFLFSWLSFLGLVQHDRWLMSSLLGRIQLAIIAWYISGDLRYGMS